LYIKSETAHVISIVELKNKLYYSKIDYGKNSDNCLHIITSYSAEAVFLTHQCKTCFTIYDERFGDSVNDIPVGVKWADLPSDY